MSPIVDFNEDDLNRGKIVTPGWYRMRVGQYAEKASAKGDSTNWMFEDSEILFNADDASKDFAGVKLTIRFNSKAKGFLIGFFEALGADVKAGSRFKLEDASGKELDVYIENDTYEGRFVNRINHKYRKPRAEAATQATT